MGSKGKYLIFLFMFCPVFSNAQEKPDFVETDSLTYHYYLSGDWKNLIRTGRTAIASGVDYKYLRQRLGHASSIRGDHYDARTHFEKALAFDSFNSFTLENLYYSYLNTGREEYAGRIVQKLDPELKKTLSIVPFRLITGIELEYNYKYATSALRSNPQYFRLGIYSKLGYRLSLFQSYSGYSQIVTVQETAQSAKYNTYQPGYYAILNFNATERLMIRTAYHHIKTFSGALSAKGNLFLISIAPDFNRLSFEGNGSILMTNGENLLQAGLESGFVFPGRTSFYLRGGASMISHNGDLRFIFNPRAGLKLFRNVLLEGNFTAGRLTGYNDYNGMYVYNSYDPVVMRTGALLVFYPGRNITLWANYTYEKKEYFENNLFGYNQFSYLGGIRWKL